MEDTLRSGLLSVVLPSYNEEASIPRAADTITAILIDADIPHELVFVDDGSRDRTWTVIQEQAGRHPQVRGVRFSRNFGKEAAIFAGLAQARGDCTLVMDCDLQHPPEKAVEMYRLWQEGYQVVEGVKASRGKENPLHTFAAKSFYSIIRSVPIFSRKCIYRKILYAKVMCVLYNFFNGSGSCCVSCLSRQKSFFCPTAVSI